MEGEASRPFAGQGRKKKTWREDRKMRGKKRKQSYTRKTEWMCSRSKVRFFSTIEKWAVFHCNVVLIRLNQHLSLISLLNFKTTLSYMELKKATN